jgi:uncharacterized protein (DUF433 family)
MDWSNCELVEVNPRKVSGVPIIKGTRVQADAILENYEGGSENFAIPVIKIQELLAFAGCSPRLVAR